MLDKLNAKMLEEEEIRTRERQELEQMLRNETEQLRLAKEKVLKYLLTLLDEQSKEGLAFNVKVRHFILSCANVIKITVI